MKESTIPAMQCEKCHGKGIHPLPGTLLETLRAIPRGGATSYDLHRLFPAVTPNAQNNRLEELRSLGLVTRIREGKFWRYVRTKTLRNGRALAK